MSLSARRIRFCQAYLADPNATKAAESAGYSVDSAHTTGSRLLQIAEVQAYLTELKEQDALVAGLSRQWVLKQWMQIASADPNELVRVKSASCCRYCWGSGFAYQWTIDEFTKALTEALDAGNLAPDGLGGFGFDDQRDSNADCPQCKGGKPTYVAAASSDRLKGSARRLYAGAKQTKDGIVILMRDQDAAVANLAKYQGMLIDKKELSGPGGGPIRVAESPRELTEEELLAIAAKDA